MTQQEQERKAIIDCYRKRFPKHTPDAYDSFADSVMRKLSELRKTLSQTESFFEWAQRNGYAMRSDGKWSRGSAIETDESLMMMYNSELRKPSEYTYPPKPDRQQIVDALNTFKASGEDAGCWADAIIDSFKQSEPSKDLVYPVFSEQCIRDVIFDSFQKTAIKNVNGAQIVGLSNLAYFAIEILKEFKKIKLMSSSPNQQNDVNEKLLEALKRCISTLHDIDSTLFHFNHSILGWHSNGDEEPIMNFVADFDMDAIIEAEEAISNAEKQIKS